MRCGRFDLVTTERVAKVTERLVQGGTVTTEEIARQYEIHPETARVMLCKISRVLPVVEEDGHWWYLA